MKRFVSLWEFQKVLCSLPRPSRRPCRSRRGSRGDAGVLLHLLVHPCFMSTQIMVTGIPQHLLCTLWCTVHTEASMSTFVGDRSGPKVPKEYFGVMAVRFQDPFEKNLHQNASRRISGLQQFHTSHIICVIYWGFDFKDIKLKKCPLFIIELCRLSF